MANQQFSIDDLIPEEATFSLSSLSKTYTIRPVNIEDWTHLKRKYGERLGDVLQGKDWQEICAIVFRLLSDDDKEDFIARDCTFFDEDTGEKSKGRIGGAKLLAARISSIAEFVEISKALYKAIGAGKPLEKVEPESKEDTKKKKENPPE